MILNRRTGKKLIATGKAKFEGVTVHRERRYAILTRYDIQRTDHYPLLDDEMRNID